ncbi:oxygenase MpaB family protein [Streptacidiphilus sp. EB103A]|uniref:oxygenase MpaB family protein n=1 Tax=Streptacidiphilus sp. EB103A TaxID=3156275 RepID=UPI003518C003
MGRYSRLRFIRTLDPDRDHERISNMVSRYEFPFDYRLGFEYAVMIDNAVPSISGLLVKTGQFRDHGQKRFDDTMLFEYELKRAGLDSPHGRTAVRALNTIHGRYDITNDDYLFILASQTLGPIDWINTYGWRRLTGHEARALVNTNRRMGELMGIKDIPLDLTGFRTVLETTLRDRARYQDTNRQATESVIQTIARWYPAPLRPLIPHAVTALVAPYLRPLLGLPDPHGPLEYTVRTALKARGRALRLAPPRPAHHPYTPHPNSYPAGWTIAQLGPGHGGRSTESR